jgi:hypothetical protein
LTAENDDLTSQTSDITSKYADLTRANADLQSLADGWAGENEDLQTQVDDLQGEVEDLQSQLADAADNTAIDNPQAAQDAAIAHCLALWDYFEAIKDGRMALCLDAAGFR